VFLLFVRKEQKKGFLSSRSRVNGINPHGRPPILLGRRFRFACPKKHPASTCPVGEIRPSIARKLLESCYQGFARARKSRHHGRRGLTGTEREGKQPVTYLTGNSRGGLIFYNRMGSPNCVSLLSRERRGRVGQR